MTVPVFQQAAEGTALLSARLAFGDEAVAEAVLSQDYDAGFVDRHPRQLAALMEAVA